MYKPILNLANKIEKNQNQFKLESVLKLNTAVNHIIYYCT